MKNVALILSLIASSLSFQIESCPTCQGRVSPESPPFFTDEFYTNKESMDYIYQQMLSEQDAQVPESVEDAS